MNVHTLRISFPELRQGGLWLSGGLLAVVLTAAPAVAQSNVAPAAMVEGNPTDINSWNFAARVPVGGTITWRNQGSQGHTVTASDGSFDSGIVAPGASPMAIVEANSSDINSWGFAVSVSAGQSIQWVNLGSQAHTVTAADNSFDTGLVAPGGSGQLEFDTPGIYAYACTPHPWMKGNVAVS